MGGHYAACAQRVDLLGYVRQKSRDARYPHREGTLEAQRRNAQAVLLGRLYASLKAPSLEVVLWVEPDPDTIDQKCPVRGIFGTVGRLLCALCLGPQLVKHRIPLGHTFRCSVRDHVSVCRLRVLTHFCSHLIGGLAGSLKGTRTTADLSTFNCFHVVSRLLR